MINSKDSEKRLIWVLTWMIIRLNIYDKQEHLLHCLVVCKTIFANCASIFSITKVML